MKEAGSTSCAGREGSNHQLLAQAHDRVNEKWKQDEPDAIHDVALEKVDAPCKDEANHHTPQEHSDDPPALRARLLKPCRERCHLLTSIPN